MFVDIAGRPLSGDQFRTCFQKHCLQNMDINMRPSDYRHAAQAYMEKVLDEIPLQSPIATPFNGQMGHSARTGFTAYAASQIDFRFITRENLRFFRICSTAWHSFLNLVKEAKKKTAPRLRQQPVVLGDTEDQQEVVEDNCGAANMMLPIQDFISVVNNPVCIRSKEYGYPNIDEIAIIAAHKSLQLMVGKRIRDSNANFRSPHQANAIAAAIQKKEDVLVVLPTGGGKSFIFMVPALLEADKEMSTIVIVPLAILLLDLQKGCKEFGLNCLVYNPTKSSRKANVILVQVEHASTEDFYTFLLNLQVQRKLSRIVFDECHCFIHMRTFRIAMDKCSKYWKTSCQQFLCQPQYHHLRKDRFQNNSRYL